MVHTSKDGNQPRTEGCSLHLGDHDLTSQEAASLEELQRRFDVKLASLDQADAGERLSSVMRNPAKLHGKVIAGETY